MKYPIYIFIFTILMIACGSPDSLNQQPTKPCTVYYSDTGSILIKCPDGTEVNIVPVPDDSDGPGDECIIEETSDSYILFCGDSEIKIPKFDEDDLRDLKPMRCKKKHYKKFKCNRENS